MTIAEMFGQSGLLALLGMGIVFAFLAILIACVSFLGKFVHAAGWDKDLQAKPAVAPSAVGGGGQNAAVTAAITAAVTEYRKTNA